MFPISFCEWDSPLPGLRSCKTETRKLCGQIFERTIDTGGPELPFLFVHATASVRSWLRGYKRRVECIVLGPYFNVSCSGPECQSKLRVPAKMGDSAQSMTERVRDLLIEAGWTKDSRGMDRCAECSKSPATLTGHG